ncbi:VanW family protein [Deinococcus budaensis]|uniref:Vancomycin resistance protein YoaR n=1 Tax=Deinococcus budaensis TaxID=1665626 RepID=A0A7W8GD21_9DEIO|nr:VanW family protein [Deinococcus budaensis]MBB5233321.1 vancomycin resistance protein YoaR [Deinococcus budaensis]
MTHQADQRPSRPLVLRRGLTRTATLAAALMLVSAGLAPPVRADVPAAPRPLLLKVTAPEPVLRGGVVVPGQVTRTYSLTLDAGERRLLRARQPSREQPSRDLNALLEQVYARIEARTPRDARFVRVGGEWTAQAQTGWRVRRAETAERLRAALERPAAGRGALEVEVALRLTPPARTVADLHERGVVAHLASGESGFAGSPEFRVHNIRVGSSRLHGVWLEPGAVFDFNALIGRISKERGFVPGYVIAGQSLTMEPGGGICQVSTTVFRAAYLAGLEVVERHAHSHQVAYYDPPGFEATVYAPAKNLRFRNDTASPLLMQAAWDLEAGTLSIHLFGGPPDRQVQVSPPRIRDLRPALAPSFVPAPDLKPGEARRIDLPASGMRVRIERTVRRDGKVRRDETLSHYRPWGGVFAVAPGDERLR